MFSTFYIISNLQNSFQGGKVTLDSVIQKIYCYNLEKQCLLTEKFIKMYEIYLQQHCYETIIVW